MIASRVGAFLECGSLAAAFLVGAISLNDIGNKVDSILIREVQTEQRISWLTLLFGFATAAIAAALQRKPWALGLAIGTVLAWLNFRWLRRGLDALVLASKAQEGLEKPRVPRFTYFAALFRYALLVLSVYLIYTYLHVPLGSMIVGMCALAAAALAASVWEILRPVN